MVRDYQAKDKAALIEIHRKSGLDYQFPDLDNPLFFVKKVLEFDGKIRAAAVLKGCAETMLLLGDGHPKDRFAAIGILQGEILEEAYAKGLDEIHAAVPEIGFDKRLLQLGWSKDRCGWKLWSHSTKALID